MVGGVGVKEAVGFGDVKWRTLNPLVYKLNCVKVVIEITTESSCSVHGIQYKSAIKHISLIQ